MRTAAARPYLVPPADTVDADPWIDQLGAPLGPSVNHWDSATNLTFTRDIVVDADRIRDACQLGSDATLTITTAWFSTATRLSGHGDPIELATLPGRLAVTAEIHVPAGRVGATLRLRTRLVLRHNGAPFSPIAPSDPGSILWSDEHTTLVEGSAGRFPIAITDFGGSGYPTSAAWALHWNPRHLHEPVLGDFQLLINSLHPTVVDAVRTGSADPRSAAIRSMIEYDIARTIVHSVLLDDEFLADPASYDDGTVGHLAHQILTTVFPGVALRTLADWTRDLPDRIDTRIQETMGLLA